MKKPQPYQNEEELILRLLEFRDDPEAFVMYVWPWGVQGTPLENHKGPRAWQRRALRKIKKHIQENHRRVNDKQDPELLKMARASGRGIGKSAFLSWVAIWLFSTIPSSTVIVSANTEQQLKGTTFPEIRKWATMALHSHWFEHAAMSLRPSDWLVEALKKSTKLDDAYWTISARLWSAETPDAYAGAHSQAGMAVLFDEASGIDSCIWPVAQGFFTDKTTHRLWFAISNPRNPAGAFFDCFHGPGRDSWDTETIDAREVTENDRTLYDDIINKYGPDSDQARVEVYGQFPQTGDQQFIGRGVATEASRRETYNDPGAPLILSVDPARFGDDNAVLCFRKGDDARSIPWEVYPKLDLVELAEKVARAVNRYKPDMIMVEGDGVGGGLIDILKSYRYQVVEVKAGGGAVDKDQYSNHRTEMWGRMRAWLQARGSIPEDDKLLDDLSAPEYEFTLKGQIRLEPKEKMKKRGYASPDRADALAISFSKIVARSDRPTGALRRMKTRVASNVDYDIFGG